MISSKLKKATRKPQYPRVSQGQALAETVVVLGIGVLFITAFFTIKPIRNTLREGASQFRHQHERCAPVVTLHRSFFKRCSRENP